MKSKLKLFNEDNKRKLSDFLFSFQQTNKKIKKKNTTVTYLIKQIELYE